MYLFYPPFMFMFSYVVKYTEKEMGDDIITMLGQFVCKGLRPGWLRSDLSPISRQHQDLTVLSPKSSGT